MLNDLLAKNQSSDKLFVEDVFSTWLYTGTGASQTITNGVDLAGKGGLVWIKSRSATANNVLVDTVRGAYANLSSNLTSQSRGANTVTNFNSTGFTVTNDTSDATFMNTTGVSGTTYASWTFRKAPKFFDVVTYTGNGASTRDIAHSLGVAPGMIIVKNTGAASNWFVWHRSIDNNIIFLERTDAAVASTGFYFGNSSTQTASNFRILSAGGTNANGSTYVAYLFAHDTTANGVIQCGSATVSGNNASVTLGWEPQFVLIKSSSNAENWIAVDNMRGFPVGGPSTFLNPNLSGAEGSGYYISPTSTGFNFVGAPNYTYTYLAIRRGPMRVPTDATKVYTPVIYTGNNTANRIITGINFSPDTVITLDRNKVGISAPNFVNTRLTNEYLTTNTTDQDFSGSPGDVIFNAVQNGYSIGTVGYINVSDTMVSYSMLRAPGFMDTACYSGTGIARTVSHNLSVAPELMIVKRRDAAAAWQVYVGAAGEYLVLNTTAAKVTSNTDRWNNTAPTSTVFSLGTDASVNASGGAYVAYLFATCPGVSKVGSYTGTGTTNQINCGFTGGARFVLIKRTDTTGSWHVWDTARGIVAGNDPYLILNTTAAEVTNTDYIDPLSTGFELSSTAPAALNANGGTYIYLAIA